MQLHVLKIEKRKNINLIIFYFLLEIDRGTERTHIEIAKFTKNLIVLSNL